MSGILIAVTSPFELIQDFLDKNNNLKGYDILVSSENKSIVESLDYKNLFVYKDNKLSPFDFSLIFSIRKRRYDKIYFFYANGNGRYYENVELFLMLCGAGEVVGVFPKGGNNKLNYNDFLRCVFVYLMKSVDIVFALFFCIVFLVFAFVFNLFSRYFVLKNKIVFVGSGNKYSASFRVRCRDFANCFRKKGFSTYIFNNYKIDKNIRQAKNPLFYFLPDFFRVVYVFVGFLKIALGRYEIVYCQKVSYHALSGYLASLYSKKIFVLDYDDYDFANFPELFENLSRFDLFRLKGITYFLMKRCDLFVAASRRIEELFGKMAKKCVYVPTVPELERYRCKSWDGENGKVIISWIGTVYKKNVFWLYDLLELYRGIENDFKKQGKDLVLEIAGGGDFYESVRKYAEKSGIENVIFKGWVENRDIPKYLLNVDIGVVHYSDNTEYERCKSPTKLFEYMACCIPCVVSSVGEAKFVVEDGKDGFLAVSNEEFLEKLKRLAFDFELRKYMGKNARKKIENHYNFNGFLDKLIKEIEYA